jgi:hypothetical protein
VPCQNGTRFRGLQDGRFRRRRNQKHRLVDPVSPELKDFGTPVASFSRGPFRDCQFNTFSSRTFFLVRRFIRQFLEDWEKCCRRMVLWGVEVELWQQ